MAGSVSSVESLSASLVREYLSRKGLKRTLEKLDSELPRDSESISNRVSLMKALHIENLVKNNKDLHNYRTMLEIVVDSLANPHYHVTSSHSKDSSKDSKPITSVDVSTTSTYHTTTTTLIQNKIGNFGTGRSSEQPKLGVIPGDTKPLTSPASRKHFNKINRAGVEPHSSTDQRPLTRGGRSLVGRGGDSAVGEIVGKRSSDLSLVREVGGRISPRGDPSVSEGISDSTASGGFGVEFFQQTGISESEGIKAFIGRQLEDDPSPSEENIDQQLDDPNMVRGVREIKRSQDPNALTNTSIKGEKDIIHDPSSEGRVPVLDGRTNSLMDERGQPVKVKPAMEKKVQPVVMNRRVNPLLDRTGRDMDGTRRVNPAMDGTGRVNPAMDGTGRVNPAMDGTGRVNPPVDGTGRVNPPMEGRVRLNPAMERRFKDSSVQQHGPLTGSKETVPALPSTKGMDLSPLSSKTKARSSSMKTSTTTPLEGGAGDMSLFSAIERKSLPALASTLTSPRSKPRNNDLSGAKLDSKLVFEDVEDLDLKVDLPPNPSFGPGSRIGMQIPPGIPISSEDSKALKKLLFGDASSRGFNSEWLQQNLVFNDIPHLEYGLVQHKGGPCGVLAALQANVLSFLIFKDLPTPSDKATSLRPTSEQRNQALVSAMAKIIWQAGNQKGATMALIKQGHTNALFSSNIMDKLTLVRFDKKNHMIEFIQTILEKFMVPSSYGCILFLVSVIITRGIALVCSDMDVPSTSLIAAHGYCTQELVNLLLTGKAVSNVFDGVINLDTGAGQTNVLKGIDKKCDIGLFSLFEHYGSCKVGMNYKTPVYPIFVVCSESHFLVLFSTVKELMSKKELQNCFDMYYYDGLSNQKESIRLTIRTVHEGRQELKVKDTDLTPPIELCIKTRWESSLVDWNGAEKLL